MDKIVNRHINIKIISFYAIKVNLFSAELSKSPACPVHLDGWN
jgi:hypothetical protein